MKRTVIKSGVLTAYIFLMLWLVDFKLLILFDGKLIIIFIFGTFLLTSASYKRGEGRDALIVKLRWNAQLTAYLSTIMLQLSYFSSDYNSESMLYDAAMNFRPLFYALLLMLVIGDYPKPKKQEDKEGRSDINEMHNNKKDLFEKLSGYGLTSRERSVVEQVLLDLSNKEIGEALNIAETTVKKHIQNILHKTGSENRETLKKLLM